MMPGVPGRALRPLLCDGSCGPPGPPSQSRRGSLYHRLPNGQRLGAEVGCDGSPQPAEKYFLLHVAQEPRVTPPLVLRTTAQEKAGSITKMATVSMSPLYSPWPQRMNPPINLLHARVRPLDPQPRPPRPGLAGCSWFYSFRLGGRRENSNTE